METIADGSSPVVRRKSTPTEPKTLSHLVTLFVLGIGKEKKFEN